MIITEQAKKEAKEYADKIIALGITDPDHPSGVNGGSIFERFFTGYLGEWAFNQILIAHRVKDKILWDREVRGHGDDGDFFFGGKDLDIKTASKDFHVRLMIPLAQWKRKQSSYYVGVKITDDEINIMGYATKEDIEHAKVDDFGMGETSWIFHNQLRPIKDLIDQEILKKWDKE